MDTTVTSTLMAGLGLAGVLALGATWARAARTGVPHLAVGGVAALGAAAGGRLASAPVVALVAAAVLGALAGGGLRLAERHPLRDSPSGRGVPLLADAAMLVVVGALTAVVTPSTVLPIAFGPLGGMPSAGAAATAAVLSGGLAIALGAPAAGRFAPALRWAAAGAGLAVAGLLASGAVGDALTGMVLPPAADAGALAFRVFAVALVARDPLDAAGGGVALAAAETVLRVLDPTGGYALLPAAAVALVGLRRLPAGRAATGAPA